MSGSLTIFDNFEQALAGCGEYVTLVRGVSMYPMIRFCKDPVLIHPVTAPLKRYDVAVYFRGDRYVVHRVLEVHPDHYVIRGDNCEHKEYIPKENIRGKVVGFWRNGRYISETDRGYRAYSRLWVKINLLVRLHHKARRSASAILHFLTGN